MLQLSQTPRGARKPATCHFAIAAAFVSFLAMAPTAAYAQPRDPAAAETLFRAARDDMNAGNYAVACPRFDESFALDPAPGTLLNLALCYEKAGKTATAWQKWQQAMDLLGESDRRFAEARAHRDALDPQLAKIVVTLAPGFPEDATILKDGAPLGRGSVGLALPVDPGPHELVVRFRGGEKATKLEAPAAKVTPIILTAPEPREAPATDPATKPSAPPAEEEASGSSAQSTVGWILVAGGGAGLAFFGVTGALILSDDSTAQANCKGACNEDGQAAVDRGDALLIPNAIGLVAGVALAGAGLTLILLDPGEGPSTALTVGPGTIGARTTF